MRKNNEIVTCPNCKKKLKFINSYSDVDFDQHFHKKCFIKEFKNKLL